MRALVLLTSRVCSLCTSGCDEGADDVFDEVEGLVEEVSDPGGRNRDEPGRAEYSHDERRVELRLLGKEEAADDIEEHQHRHDAHDEMDDPLDAEQVEETLKRIERILESFSGLIFHTGSTSNEKLAGALWLLDEEPLRFKGVGKDRRMVSRNREKGRVMREEGT